ncbi:hypothetical protein EGT71_14135 [Atlantibacter subterranea]|uniref:DUF5375 domain-containing protein n=1 Tax=Atlantibacter subterraneus TaxID=255519 RepID=A0A427UWF8_9ENTR|nr:hypothetical protein [Atlantibacter subterranea]RSB59830.1 hypothetical protein EGK67_19070 [Atlantibacter subterranea]RSE03805.1 hypothetical protein EGT84_15680 [Atlantibacter subterranea]RSE24807.1 hypothetical protein EGT71_14135 [Atlantibacter subterranea]
MINNDIVLSPAFRTALLRRYIADAFITMMTRINGEPVYTEDGERVLLTPEKVALNILFHIEAPWMDEFGMEDGSRLAAEALERMLTPGFMGEALRLSVAGVTEMREVYRDIIFGAPDGELPAGFEFVHGATGEVYR